MIRWLRRLFSRPDADAVGLFHADRDRLVAEFLRVGRESGKPRGLAWLSVEINGDPLFARDRTGARFALLPVTVAFEPLPGSELEDVPQAREPRPVAAVFAFAGRAWSPTGKVVFNLTPREAAARSGWTRDEGE